MLPYIVITTIFPPTEAVKSFAQNKNYKLIVVGDKKTPEDWSYTGAKYLSVSQQINNGFKLSKVLHYNHYCRKMLGYLDAIKNGALMIVDTDDDNIPKKDWGFPLSSGKYKYISENFGFINIYNFYTTSNIWPRGLPLQFIDSLNRDNIKLSTKRVKVGIWQGLADDDPDVDAVYRLTNDTPCFFENNGEYVLGKGTISPFNSQNTLFIKELFPLLYLPTYVTFRFTDILRGLVAQPIMWAQDYLLGFCHATVVQKRNPHDYLRDFESEIPMYLHGYKIIDLIIGKISAANSIEANLYNAYLTLLNNKIVEPAEIKTLEAWLNDLQILQKNQTHQFFGKTG